MRTVGEGTADTFHYFLSANHQNHKALVSRRGPVATTSVLNNGFPRQALMAHAYNPSYSGGKDQEDRCSKPAWENSLRVPSQNKPSQKGLVE
jgi:hypothetical protein